jgi:hypothetical protein
MDALRRSTLLIFCCLPLAGCTSRSYFVSEMSVEPSDEEAQALLSANKKAPPANADPLQVEQRSTIYSGKRLKTGSWIWSPTTTERMDVVLRNGQVYSARRNIQMIRVRFYYCGNIAGHGDFCGIEKYHECEMWSRHDLRNHCPEVTAVASTNEKPISGIQKATAAPAPHPTIVYTSPGDPLAGASPRH